MHLELLRNTKAMLEQSGEWAEYKGVALDPVEGAPIFSRERVEQNVVAYTSDLSALRVAYLIEKDAVDFYTHAAQQTDDPNGKRMFWRPGRDGTRAPAPVAGRIRLFERAVSDSHGLCALLAREAWCVFRSGVRTTHHASRQRSRPHRRVLNL